MELFLRFAGFWISKEFKDAGPSIYAALFYALNYNTICAIIFFFFFFVNLRDVNLRGQSRVSQNQIHLSRYLYLTKLMNFADDPHSHKKRTKLNRATGTSNRIVTTMRSRGDRLKL